MVKNLFAVLASAAHILKKKKKRICLPMQGTGVRSLIQEDPTCCKATEPVHYNY